MIIVLLCLVLAIQVFLVLTQDPKRIKKVFTIARRLVWGSVFYLLKPFPKDKGLMIFGGDNGAGFSGNPKYLFLEAQKRPGIRAVWITKSGDVYKKLKEQGLPVELANSQKGMWTQLRAGTVVLSYSIKEDFNAIFLAGATSVNLWHGVGLKRSWFRNTLSFSGKAAAAAPSFAKKMNMWWACTNLTRENYVISTSEEVGEYYPATYHVPKEHVINLGQARNDVFYDDSLEEQNLPDFFHEKKVIIYMPTHRNYGRGGQKMERNIGKNIDYGKLSAMLEKYGWVFVIKQHRWVTHTTRTQYPNIIDITHENYDLDPQLILKYSDLVITDYSSCYTDFLLLDRPVMFFCYDLDEYLDRWELNFDYDYVTPGPKVWNSDQLIAELEKILQGNDEYEEERQRVKRVFYSPWNQQAVTGKQMDYILENLVK